MKLITVAFACGLMASAGAHAQDARALLEKYRCNACHAATEAKTGPAYLDVAERYRGDSNALTTLSTEIRNGAHGAGPWHMPPHPEVSRADARAMARYILGLKK